VDYILSIVMPTHNRSKYAKHAIDSVLSIKSSNIQLVVSDTSTDGGLAEYLSSNQEKYASDFRFKYIQPGDSLDMTGNHNYAISQADGEYVCLIGDDDTVLPNCIAIAEWARNNKINIISQRIVANYVWPDFKHRYFGSAHAGRLYIGTASDVVEYKFSRPALINSLLGAAQGTEGLPKLYHGIVKRELLEKIYSISGSYCHGSSPDISLSIGLSLVSDSFIEVAFPITIPGASGGSNTGRSAMNKHKGDLSEESQTKVYVKEGWDSRIPKFFSVETVWAHSALLTLEKINPDDICNFNFPYLIAICKAFHSDKKENIEAAKIGVVGSSEKPSVEIGKLISKYCFNIKIGKVKYYFRRLLIPTPAGGRYYVSNVKNIHDASNAFSVYEKEKGIWWCPKSGPVINSTR